VVVNMWKNKCKYLKTWSTWHTNLICTLAVVCKKTFGGNGFGVTPLYHVISTVTCTHYLPLLITLISPPPELSLA
jgi:hypothetical protein